jgi:Ser-tRNA(Ala) deacylase AlaX
MERLTAGSIPVERTERPQRGAGNTSPSPNLFLAQPYLMRLDTCIAAARRAENADVMLCLEQTIARGAAGGQPEDFAALIIDGIRREVLAIEKSGGRTWMRLTGLARVPLVGAPVCCEIDAARRRALTRSHSLIHLLMAAIRWSDEGYRSRGAEISANAHDCTLWFDALELTETRVKNIEAFARAAIARAVPVDTVRLKSISEGPVRFPHWRVDPALALDGKVRVIEIGDGIDANPCSGTHVNNLSEIGEFTVAGFSAAEGGCGYELRVRITEMTSPGVPEKGAFG